MSFLRAMAYALAFITILSQPRQAGSATGTLQVNASVTASACTIGSATLAFGAYESGQKADLKKEGSISYATCPTGKLTVELGGGWANNVSARRMNGPGDSPLNYQIYSAGNRKKVWGTGSAGLSVKVANSGSGSIPIYGTIPAGQNAVTGNYYDQVVITVGF